MSLLGDVNNDGEVGVADIATLIDYVLATDVIINKFNADVSDDNMIDIKDVADLIDMILSGEV